MLNWTLNSAKKTVSNTEYLLINLVRNSNYISYKKRQTAVKKLTLKEGLPRKAGPRAQGESSSPSKRQQAQPNLRDRKGISLPPTCYKGLYRHPLGEIGK